MVQKNFIINLFKGRKNRVDKLIISMIYIYIYIYICSSNFYLKLSKYTKALMKTEYIDIPFFSKSAFRYYLAYILSCNYIYIYIYILRHTRVVY